MIHPRSICQIEIPVTDRQRALQFYETVFGWRLSPAEIHEYLILDVSEDSPVGVALLPVSTQLPINRDNQVVVYFTVDDGAQIAEKAIAAGGSKRFGPRETLPYGQIWQIADPDGNRFGLFQPRK